MLMYLTTNTTQHDDSRNRCQWIKSLRKILGEEKHERNKEENGRERVGG